MGGGDDDDADDEDKSKEEETREPPFITKYVYPDLPVDSDGKEISLLFADNSLPSFPMLRMPGVVTKIDYNIAPQTSGKPFNFEDHVLVSSCIFFPAP